MNSTKNKRTEHIETTTVFMNGKSQAVRIPKELRLNTKKVYIKKMGNCIILIPMDDPWQLLFDSLDEFPKDFMENKEALPDQEREEIFK